MEIGDLVIWNGRLCVLRGVQPMSVPDRRADLEDAQTAERLAAPLAELSPAPPPPRPGVLEPPAA